MVHIKENQQDLTRISQKEEKQTEISDSDEYMLELKNKLSRIDNEENK